MIASSAKQPNKLHYARAFTHLCYGLLLVSICAWQIIRPGGPLYTFWLIQLVPLLILLPGMRQANPRTYIWLCLILLMYFLKGVDGIMSPSSEWIDYVFVTLSVLLFNSAMLTSRWLHSNRNKTS